MVHKCFSYITGPIFELVQGGRAVRKHRVLNSSLNKQIVCGPYLFIVTVQLWWQLSCSSVKVRVKSNVTKLVFSWTAIYFLVYWKLHFWRFCWRISVVESWQDRKLYAVDLLHFSYSIFWSDRKINTTVHVSFWSFNIYFKVLLSLLLLRIWTIFSRPGHSAILRNSISLYFPYFLFD